MTARSIVEVVFHHAAYHPEKLCLIDEEQSVTYSQYTAMILRFAESLRRVGIEPGNRVVVEAKQSISYLAIELALHLLGAVFVPLERNCAGEKIAAIAARCDASAIITAKPLHTDRKVYSYEVICSTEDAGVPVTAPVFPNRDTISEILFSTGTTGKEKGIVLTHGNDIALAENVMYGVEMQEDNVEMIPSPLNHSHGLRRYYGNMLCGGTVVLATSVINMRAFFERMDRYGVNSLDLVPTALSVLLKLSKNKLAEYKEALRYIQLGAAPLLQADKDKLKEMLPHTRLYNFYGSTESGCICIYNFNQAQEKPSCIGKPTHNVKIIITDEKRREIQSSPENVGLLASFGAMNMLGYWMDPEETARAMEDGYIYSNDEAYFDADGDIILLGRKGDVINVGGNKVSPEEIENACKKIAGVADCGCIPVADDMKGHVPKLFVQMESGCTFDPKAIRSQLSELLEPYKIPKYVEEIEKIPRSYNGKLLRRELRALQEHKLSVN